MDSSDLYHTKQQFFLGAFRSLVNADLPDENSSDYLPTLLYQARSYIAIGEPEKAEEIVPEDTDSLSLKAVRALAKYTSSKTAADQEKKDAALEELRDLCVEIEGEDASENDKMYVKVIAGTAFVSEGEVEEALETLGAGTSAENLEATSLTVQIYLSIHRPDLAKKEFERASKWAEDDLLLQQIEATIDLVTGKDNYSNPFSYFSEQLGNPSLSSPHLLTARGVTRLLRGEVAGAKSDLEEALKGSEDADTLCASLVASSLGAGKRGDAESLFRHLSSKYPEHPLVKDLSAKSKGFDELAAKYTVPPIAARG